MNAISDSLCVCKWLSQVVQFAAYIGGQAFLFKVLRSQSLAAFFPVEVFVSKPGTEQWPMLLASSSTSLALNLFSKNKDSTCLLNFLVGEVREVSLAVVCLLWNIGWKELGQRIKKNEDMQQLWCEIPLAECFLCRLPTSLFLKAICTSEPIAWETCTPSTWVIQKTQKPKAPGTLQSVSWAVGKAAEKEKEQEKRQQMESRSSKNQKQERIEEEKNQRKGDNNQTYQQLRKTKPTRVAKPHKTNKSTKDKQKKPTSNWRQKQGRNRNRFNTGKKKAQQGAEGSLGRATRAGGQGAKEGRQQEQGIKRRRQSSNRSRRKNNKSRRAEEAKRRRKDVAEPKNWLVGQSCETLLWDTLQAHLFSFYLGLCFFFFHHISCLLHSCGCLWCFCCCYFLLFAVSSLLFVVVLTFSLFLFIFLFFPASCICLPLLLLLLPVPHSSLSVWNWFCFCFYHSPGCLWCFATVIYC